jgi:hypothetical protein
MHGCAMTAGLLILLGPTSPGLTATVHSTTYEDKTLQRWHTIWDDGTRAVSRYNKTLQRWDTTITASLRKACTARMDLRTQHVEVRCR